MTKKSLTTKPNKIHNSRAGFTLVEVLVATFIFSIIATLSFQALNGWIKQDAKLQARFDGFGQLQRAYAQLQEDISHTLNRPVRDGLGDHQPSLMLGLGGHLLELSTMSLKGGQPKAVRVGFRIDGDSLYRDTWPVLDRAFNSQPQTLKLVDDIEEITIKAIDKEEQELPLWPPNQSGINQNALTELPIGIKIQLQHQKQNYEFFFLTPQHG